MPRGTAKKEKRLIRLTGHANMSHKRTVQAPWIEYLALQDLLFVFRIPVLNTVPGTYYLFGVGI